MSECPYCHSLVSDTQVLCMKCGSQIKPLEVKRRFFIGKRNYFLFVKESSLIKHKSIKWRPREPKPKLTKPPGNMTLDPWI